MAESRVYPSKSQVRLRIGQASCVCLLAAAFFLRVSCAANDLWQDEIVSIFFIGFNKISSPIEIITTIHQDNNHYLNTLWIYACGTNYNPIVYRSVSIVAGVASVVVSALIAKRKGPTCVLFTTIVTSFSYMLVVYATEARGYGTAILFSLLLYFLQESYLTRKSWAIGTLISITIIGGLLSHLSFVIIFLASFSSLAFEYFAFRRPLRLFLQEAGVCYGAPVILLVFLYLLDIRHQIVGGGPGIVSPSYGYLNGLVWTVGASFGRWWVVLISLIIAPFLCIGIYGAWRENRAFSVFLVGGILVFPLATAAASGQGQFYPRYFIVGTCYVLVMLGRLLSSLYQHNGRQRTIAFVILGSFLLINGFNDVKLMQYGRGSYREAIEFLSNNSRDPSSTVGSNEYLHTYFVFNYYAPIVAAVIPLTYCSLNSPPANGIEWVIWQEESTASTVPPLGPIITLRSRNGDNTAYRWVKTFPSAPLSGQHWFAYHKQD